MSLGMVACLTPSDTVTVMRPLWRLLIWVPTFCGSAEMMFPLATVSLYASEEVNGMFATFSELCYSLHFAPTMEHSMFSLQEMSVGCGSVQ